MRPGKIISPSLLASDFSNLESEIIKLTIAKADWLHLDIMDGHFVPNLTFGPFVVSAIRKITKLFLDTHLMITEPEKYVLDFLNAGSDLITLHIESTNKMEEMINVIKLAGKKVGISLKPGTDVKKLIPFLDKVDLVLVMTVEPGFGGQSFMFDQVKKIEWLDEYKKINQLSYLIEVDGGISDKTRAHLDLADVLVAGTYIFKGDYEINIDSLR